MIEYCDIAVLHAILIAIYPIQRRTVCEPTHRVLATCRARGVVEQPVLVHGVPDAGRMGDMGGARAIGPSILQIANTKSSSQT